MFCQTHMPHGLGLVKMLFPITVFAAWAYQETTLVAHTQHLS